jgi:hypothetical protein
MWMQERPAVIVFAICLLAGLLMFRNYGISWDESLIGIYANQSLDAYADWGQKGAMKFEHAHLVHYGPFFMMVVEGAARLVGGAPAQAADLRHLMYFLVFFAGGVAFYSLARRWFDPISALGASLLYLLQPVLWGHAFINPKDAPFMSLVVISMAAGFKMVDAIRDLPDEIRFFSFDRRVVLASLFWLVSVLALYLLTDPARNWITSLVVSAKSGETNIVSLFASKLADVPAQTYITRYFVLYLRIRFIYFLVATAALLVIWHRLQPQLLRLLSIVALPALALGMASSTRILGPFVGVIVALHLLHQRTRTPVIAAFLYAVVAMMFVHAAWPFLWMNPPGNYIESILTMSAFPWRGEVLFDGTLYAATDLPLSYLPVLFAIQLTEPVWILAVIGLGVSAFGTEKRSGLLVLFALWFVLPLSALMLRGSTIFDNFRHVLFTLPPVFLLAGAAFERISNVRVRAVVIAACLLPGVVGIASLHPYEYAYYNQFIGGMKGAQGRFELEYWLTSYREAAEYVNENASPYAAIWVQGPGHLFTPYARPDLIVNSWSGYQPVDAYEFVVVSYRFDDGDTSYPNAEIVHRIMRGDAVLTVIKKP